MSPKLVSVYTECITREVEDEQSNDELSVGGTEITELRYADDSAILSTTPEGLINLVQAVNKRNAAYKLSINAAKTKIMGLDKLQENANIVIDIIGRFRLVKFHQTILGSAHLRTVKMLTEAGQSNGKFCPRSNWKHYLD